MSIRITVKNEDSRPNAVVELITTDEYGGYLNAEPHPTTRITTSRGLLRGGESKEVLVHATCKLEVIERQNG